jgi:hypothetical protein
LRIKSEWYWDSISFLNYKNLEYKTINKDVFLKKAFQKEIIIEDEKWFSIQWPKEKYVFSKCSFLDKNWKCYTWKAKIKITNYNEIQMNNSSASITRRWINKDWKIDYFYLLWASFFEIKDDKWNDLEFKKDKNFIIEYKLTDEKLKKYEDEWYIKWKIKDYYYFDKKLALWKITDAKYTLDKEKAILKLETSKIY